MSPPVESHSWDMLRMYAKVDWNMLQTGDIKEVWVYMYAKPHYMEKSRTHFSLNPRSLPRKTTWTCLMEIIWNALEQRSRGANRTG
jgi:hypothetical protein